MPNLLNSTISPEKLVDYCATRYFLTDRHRPRRRGRAGPPCRRTSVRRGADRAAELSSRVLTLEAMTGMLDELLPDAARRALDELGAVQHAIATRGCPGERFTVVAAHGGDESGLRSAGIARLLRAPGAPRNRSSRRTLRSSSRCHATTCATSLAPTRRSTARSPAVTVGQRCRAGSSPAA